MEIRGETERERAILIERGGNVIYLFTIMYTVPSKEGGNSLYLPHLLYPLSFYKAIPKYMYCMRTYDHGLYYICAFSVGLIVCLMFSTFVYLYNTVSLI